jgi:leucyl aminopeptidase
MITINLIRSLAERHSRFITVFFKQDAISEMSELNSLVPGYEQILADKKFTGKAGSIALISALQNNEVITLCCVGLGKAQNGSISIETYRRGIGKAIKALQSAHQKQGVIVIPDAKLFGATDAYVVEQTTIIAAMAAYRFDEFITDADRKVDQDITLEFVTNPSDELTKAVERGMIISYSVNRARHWVDLPPHNLTPVKLADLAIEIAKKHKLPITVCNEAEVIQMGMGGLAGVSQGSDQDCRFVAMEYKVADKNAPTICFVGKGITFDSGGLSIKPARHMETMKEDMSGAAAVISTMDAIAQLKPSVNVIGITPLSENLPSGKATKPGDILRFYNGKTAEVRNTDAEGRLILADALAYAVKHYKPDAIIDLATLTGACAYALGPFFSGMMSQHDDFVARVEEASKVSGDRVWRLPLDNDYQKVIESPVADICNSGNETYMAGAITAAFFLKAFVDDVPWVHLDIAGTAFDVPDISYYNKEGATGVGVRLLVELAMKWKQ